MPRGNPFGRSGKPKSDENERAKSATQIKKDVRHIITSESRKMEKEVEKAVDKIKK